MYILHTKYVMLCTCRKCLACVRAHAVGLVLAFTVAHSPLNGLELVINRQSGFSIEASPFEIVLHIIYTYTSQRYPKQIVQVYEFTLSIT